jgi:hypothetical protein
MRQVKTVPCTAACTGLLIGFVITSIMVRFDNHLILCYAVA